MNCTSPLFAVFVTVTFCMHAPQPNTSSNAPPACH
eukprot:COSAG01_NODE_61240_length_290_cov_1.188482_1_plen_34_part_10